MLWLRRFKERIKAMCATTLDHVSDQDLREAYQTRFRVKTGDVLSDSQRVADHLSTYLNGRSKETFAVIFLNGRNAVIDTFVMFEGTVNQAVVYPREIIKCALQFNAVAVIIGHNHPSGQLRPSEDDQRITRRIKQACEAMDLSFLDHVIIADGEYFSFADGGLL